MKTHQRHTTFPAAAVLIRVSSSLQGCVIDRSVQVSPGERRGAMRIIDGDLVVEPSGQVASVRVIDGNVTLQANGTVTGAANVTDGDLTLFCTRGRIDNTRIAATVRVRRKAL